MREEKPEARECYLQQASRENWSVRQLQRQIETRSYQRLLSTQDAVSAPESPQAPPAIRDFIKDPYVLEFLGLPEDPAASETDVESAIVSLLQRFLLEMGHGAPVRDHRPGQWHHQRRQPLGHRNHGQPPFRTPLRVITVSLETMKIVNGLSKPDI